MRDFVGTGRLLALALRRERYLLPIMVAGLTGWLLMYAVSYHSLYPTSADVEALRMSLEGNPTVIAITGSVEGLTSLPGAIVWEAVPTLTILSGLVALFLVTRHSRLEEEDGRADLLIAAGAGRLAPLASALILTAGTLTAAAIGWAAVMIAFGHDVGSSLLFALAILGSGLAFTGTAAVCAQVTGRARATRGLIGVVIGAAWILRAVGDTSNEVFTWLSPIGWVQLTQPYAADRWWVLAIPVGAAALSVATAVWLLNRRDLGSGFISPRRGPARGSASLGHPTGIAFRLQRGTVIGWTAGLALYGFAVGAIGDGIQDMIESSPAIEGAFATAGGTMLDSYFAAILTVIAVLGAGFTISSALKPASEESRNRVDLLLAAPLGKMRWAGAHLTISFLATALIIGIVGLASGIGFGVSTGDFSRTSELFASGLVQAPAMWVAGGVAVFLFGLSPRLANVAWAFLVACIVIWTMAAFAELPQWVIDLSPFSHTPLVPAVPVEVLPLAVMTAIAAALTTAGLLLWRRRDLA